MLNRLKAVEVALLILSLAACTHSPTPTPTSSSENPGHKQEPEKSHQTSPGGRPDVKQTLKPKAEDSNPITAGIRALIRAVQKVGGDSVDGKLDPKICSIAMDYARDMAEQQYQDGHRGFGQRSSLLGGAASEITAESWGWERSLQAHADECVQSWLGSSGHRSSLMGEHPRYCYAMSRGRNGKYYCVGLFADSYGRIQQMGRSPQRSAPKTTATPHSEISSSAPRTQPTHSTTPTSRPLAQSTSCATGR